MPTPKILNFCKAFRITNSHDLSPVVEVLCGIVRQVRFSSTQLKAQGSRRTRQETRYMRKIGLALAMWVAGHPVVGNQTHLHQFACEIYVRRRHNIACFSNIPTTTVPPETGKTHDLGDTTTMAGTNIILNCLCNRQLKNGGSRAPPAAVATCTFEQLTRSHALG